MPSTRRSHGKVEIKVEDDVDELAHEHSESSLGNSPVKRETEKEKVAKGGTAGLSAFERRRLENIEANQALLKDISATANKILPAKRPKPPAPAKRSRNSTVKRETPVATRRSSRVAGLEPEREEQKRKADEALAAQEDPVERAKRMRISGDLNLGDTLVDGKKWSAGLDGLQGLKGLSRGAQPGHRTFTDEDVNETTDKSLKELRLRMNGLKLYEGWAPNGRLAHETEAGLS